MTTAAVLSENGRMIALTSLRAAPWNARKTHNRLAMTELIESIRQHGIAPLIVRPMDDVYEIIAGHRRFMAAFALELEAVPCVVRDLDDDEAREAGVVDNLQREDVLPIEEAEAFGLLLAKPGSTIESVAAVLAKSPGYVGRRVQLLRAVSPVREALKAGGIEVGHALELARLTAKKQIELLSWLDCGYEASREELKQFGDNEDDDFDDDFDEEEQAEEPKGWHPTRYSAANLRKRIADTTLRVLADAPFPLDDELPPMACTECPKRSGNAQGLFDDCAQDTCTDRECYDGKVAAWIKIELKLAKEQKRKLLMVSDGYTGEKDVLRDYDVARFDKKGKCQNGVEAIWVSGEHAGQRLTICIDKKCNKHHGSRSSYSSPEPSAKDKAERKKKLDALNAEKKYRTALFKAVATAPVVEKFAAEMAIEVALYAIVRGPGQYNGKAAEALGWPKDVFGWRGDKQLRETVTKLMPVERMRAALLVAHSGELGVNEYSSGSQPVDLEKLAGFLNLDVKKIRAECSVKPVKQEAAKPAEIEKTAKPGKQPAAKKVAETPAKKAALKKPAVRKLTKPAAKKAAKKAVKKGGRK